MAELTRVIDTDRGPLLITVQRMPERYTTRELTSDDLLKAARVLFREAALLSRQARRPEPEVATCPQCGGRLKALPHGHGADYCVDRRCGWHTPRLLGEEVPA